MQRRELLWSVLASCGSVACGGAPLAAPPRIAEDAFDVDALGQAERVRRGEAQPRELVLEAIARIEALDGPINAVTTRFFEGAPVERLRIGFHTENIHGVEAHRDVRHAVLESARLCEDLGHEVFEARPDYRGEAFRELFVDLWTARSHALREQRLAESRVARR